MHEYLGQYFATRQMFAPSGTGPMEALIGTLVAGSEIPDRNDSPTAQRVAENLNPDQDRFALPTAQLAKIRQLGESTECLIEFWRDLIILTTPSFVLVKVHSTGLRYHKLTLDSGEAPTIQPLQLNNWQRTIQK